MIVLSFNCGSSSVKYQLYNWESQEIVAKGIVERVTIGNSFCVHEVNNKEKVTLKHDCPTHKEAIKLIIDSLIHPEYGAIKDLSDISAVGHRVVHGGEKFSKSVIINQEALNTFKKLAISHHFTIYPILWVLKQLWNFYLMFPIWLLWTRPGIRLYPLMYTLMLCLMSGIKNMG